MEALLDTVPGEDKPPQDLSLVFTGSGSEYFRIWIVNLLLTLITLGIYFPWAKVRKLRYFYGNTLVAGQPLGFHGDPKKMLKGYALVAVLFACYSAAGKFSPGAGLLALVVIAALWPALLKSSMQFRLANTSWRGLRFCFAGSLADAYKATLPLVVPGVLLVGASVVMGTRPEQQSQWGLAVLLMALAAMLVSPWLLWKLKNYQHTHYALGAEQTRFGASVWSFYKLSLKAFAIYLVWVPVLLLLLVFSLVGGMAGMAKPDMAGQWTSQPLILGMVPLTFLLLIGVNAFWVARAQDLLWNHTASAQVQFHSRLRLRTLFWLSIKNWLLTALTLGLYWPFAAVAVRRLRLQAVTIATSLDAEQLRASADSDAGDAAGDAAGDFFGFDIGL